MRRLLLATVLTISMSLGLIAAGPAVAQTPMDFDIPNGHFFKQANGQGGAGDTGFAVTNDGGIPFWTEFQARGGVPILGYPVTSRFTYDGFVTQAMQKVVFQWRPDVGQVYFLNTFDALHDKGFDDWLLAYRQTPKPFDTAPDTGLSWEQVVARHQAFLDQNQAIKTLYFSAPDPIAQYGLPVSYSDEGNSFVIRAQRATFQYWKEAVPWARAGEVTVANGGDLAKEVGLWPQEAATPALPGATQPSPAPGPPPGPTRAKSPEYGMSVFVYGYPEITQRDLQKVVQAGFGWQKTILHWRSIEGAGRGFFNWSETDRVVKATNDAGLQMIARVDYPPDWAMTAPTVGSLNDPQDFGNFVYALVNRYKQGSPNGRIHAVELLNEANLSREWGGRQPNAAEYTRLLRAGWEAAKTADPSITVIGGSLTPTATVSNEAVPDDVFLQQMYDAGARRYFDVLGAHAAGYKAPPEMSPAEAAANPEFGGQRVFTFRRVEDLREVMVRNGDADKQVWITEFGWTSDPVNPAYAWHRVTEEQKADYLVRAYQYAQANWSPWVGVMAVWNLPASYWTEQNEEYWWSIANPDGTNRPAYARLAEARRNGTLR